MALIWENEFVSRMALIWENELVSCMALITTIIQSIQNEVIHCWIVDIPFDIRSGHLQEWVEELVRKKGVRSLILRCGPRTLLEKNLVLPPGIFGSLHSLELEKYTHYVVSPFQSCENLQILKLSKLTLGNNIVTEILSCCKILKELSLCDCQGFLELHICSRNLKMLELRCFSIDKINISAEALITLIIDTIKCVRNCFIFNVPRVADFEAYRRFKDKEQVESANARTYLDTEVLLEHFSGILYCYEGSHSMYSSQMGYISPFNNLKVLSTSLDLNDIRHSILLSYIFRVCSLLEKLDITVEIRDEANLSCGSCWLYPEHLFWTEKEVFVTVSEYRKAVTIQKFNGKVLELEFLKYIITRAHRMQKLVIKFDDNCKTDEATAAINLLSLSKASEKVSIVLETPKAGAQLFSLDLFMLIVFVFRVLLLAHVW